MSKTENEKTKYDHPSEVDDKFTEAEVKQRFPHVNPGIRPCGTRVLLQVRSPMQKTRGGIMLPADVAEAELFLTQTAMVRELGPVAFKDRKTLEPWPEGAWVKPGMFVRMPKYNQDKWWVEYDTGETLEGGKIVFNRALFMLINDLDVLGERTGNPFAIAGYIR